MEQNVDEINDIDMIEISDGLRIATCDDSGLTLITEIKADLTTSQRKLEKKHTQSCYRCKFVGEDQLYTTGFDYKLCLWNLKDTKKSTSTNIQNLLVNELGAEAMSYNPPFVYSWASFTVGTSE